MMQLTQRNFELVKKYNVSEKQLFFAYLVAAGVQRAEAFFAIFSTKKISNENADQKAAELTALNPGLPLLIDELKHFNKKRENGGEPENLERYRTKNGVLEELIRAANGLTGKDAVSALQTVAKLQGFDKPDEQEQEERRRYFLPYVSACRNCKLMEVFRAESDK